MERHSPVQEGSAPRGVLRHGIIAHSRRLDTREQRRPKFPERAGRVRHHLCKFVHYSQHCLFGIERVISHSVRDNPFNTKECLGAATLGLHPTRIPIFCNDSPVVYF